MTHPTVQAAASWPEIAGVDSATIRELLSDDAELFEFLIQRLLEDFAEIEQPAALDSSDALAQFAASMHRVRGAAGQLAVRDAYATTSAIEACCRASDARGALALCDGLWRQMEQLRVASAEAFAAIKSNQLTPAPASGLQLSRGQVANIVALLREQNLAVLSELPALTVWARDRLTLADCERLEDHLRRMRFGEAAALLTELEL